MASEDQEPGVSELDLIISSGQAVLVVGDVWIEPGLDHEKELTLLRAIRASFSRIAGMRHESEIGEYSTNQLLALARSHDRDRTSAELRRLSSLTPHQADRWFKILNAPWYRVYDLMGFTRNLRLLPNQQLIDATTTMDFDRQFTQVISMVSADADADWSIPPRPNSIPRDMWFKQLSADVVTHPVLVITAQAHSDLWQYLVSRIGSDGVPHATPAHMVAEQLTSSDENMARLHGIKPHRCDLASFAEDTLNRRRPSVREGRRQLARTREVRMGGASSLLVERLIQNSNQHSDWQFLKGHTPSWYEINSGYLVRLARLSSLYNAFSLEPGKRNIVVLKGRAGSGKSAILMRLAVELLSKGREIAWVDRSTNLKAANLISRLADLSPDVVIIDDIDIFGETCQSLMRQLNAGGKTLVIGSVRRTTSWVLDGAFFQGVDGDTSLTDHDLQELVKLLATAGLLGSLQGVADSMRVERLEAICKRDLLGALIEVVTGQAFEKRIESEYDELSSSEQSVYAAVCVAENAYETDGIFEEDLVQVAGDAESLLSYRSAIITLASEKKLIVRSPVGVVARHRAIADVVVNHLSKVVLADYVKRMLVLTASRAKNIADSSNPERRLMIHLLNHNNMIKLGIPKQQVRGIYSAAQEMLEQDFHYWLQRGAYEVEYDELQQANIYLQSARSLPGGMQDNLVTTEWGLLQFRLASSSPSGVRECESARESFSELIRVTRSAGKNSPHTFSVVLNHGLSWLLSSTPLSPGEKSRMASQLLDVCDVANRILGENSEVRRLARIAREMLAKSEVGEESTGMRFPT